jgi:hypothetical protein
LVERDLPKVDVASSNLVIRSHHDVALERDTLPIVDVASPNLVISMARVRISSSRWREFESRHPLGAAALRGEPRRLGRLDSNASLLADE